MFSSRCGEVPTSAVQECPLGRIRCEGDCLFIGQRCFRAAAKAPEQIGAILPVRIVGVGALTEKEQQLLREDERREISPAR